MSVTFETCEDPKPSVGLGKFFERQHTLGHLDCGACAATGQMLVIVDEDLAALPFREVVPIWKELRTNDHNLKPRTHESTDGYLAALEKFFADLRLDKIHAGHLREYQTARERNLLCVTDGGGNARVYSPWKRKAGPSLINHELNVLEQILKHCKLWAPLHPYYFPRPVPGWSPRAIPEEDVAAAIREAVQRHPEVALAAWVATITDNTSASGCELRGLKLKHLVLREPTLDRHGVDRTPSEIYIPREATKNDDRPRRIPLNTTAKLAFMKCLQRAIELGASDPEHYLFPSRKKKGEYDPAKPASRWWIRHNWNKLREATGLMNLRPHDMRHIFVTRMLEGGENEETVQAICGHVSRRMMEYYSHIRTQAKLQAVMRIDSARPVPKKPPRPVTIRGEARARRNQIG